MRIIINTVSAKKHAGGAFQISLNFLLKSLDHNDVEWYYFTSQDLDNVLGDKFAHLKGTRYFVMPTQPDFKSTYKAVKKQLHELEEQIKPDLVYSITAPSYFKFKAPEVMRFTNPWVTHPNKYSWASLSLKDKFYYYLYGLNQKRLMKAAHWFVTQTETCKKGIVRITREPDTHVKVVSNVLPGVFKTMDTTQIPDSEWINVACVGNPVPHKNFDILPSLIKELKSLGLSNIRFHTTIPFDNALAKQIESQLSEQGSSQNLVNHGRLSQKELGDMYRHCQFCFLPTLLEVFSASTVEAMYFGLPIVASDFDFNREVLEKGALYYEPMNAKMAAQQFACLISDMELQTKFKAIMKEQLKVYGDYDAHFNSIKNFLIEVVKESSIK